MSSPNAGAGPDRRPRRKRRPHRAKPGAADHGAARDDVRIDKGLARLVDGRHTEIVLIEERKPLVTRARREDPRTSAMSAR